MDLDEGDEEFFAWKIHRFAFLFETFKYDCHHDWNACACSSLKYIQQQQALACRQMPSSHTLQLVFMPF